MELNQREEAMVKRAGAFAAERLRPIAAQLDGENRPPTELLEEMAGLGFFGMHYPAEWGGGGLSSVAGYLAVTELAKASAGVALLLHVHWMAVDAILKYGSDAQKSRWLPGLLSGRQIAAFVISETQAGSDAAAMAARAEKEPDGYRLNGTKYFCTNGGVADLYVLAAKTDPSAGAKGISMFLADKNTSGLSVSGPLEKMGCRSSATTALMLRDCFLSRDALLGRENGGFPVAMYGLVGGRLGMASMGLGIAEAALEETAAYANTRLAFGKPLAALYAVQEMAADMYVKIEAARHMMLATAEKRDSGADCSLETSALKVLTAQVVNEVCHKSLQIFGGHGYLKGNPAERYARDGRLMDIGVGATEVLKMVIGGTVLRNYQ